MNTTTAAAPTASAEPVISAFDGWLSSIIQPGERYAGIILAADGTPSHHLFLLPSRDNKKYTWQRAMDAAKKAGGDLPTRAEQAVLFGNAKSEFEPAWYWSNEQHAENSDFAWYQYFFNGNQGIIYKSYEGRARAVRRLIIQ